MPSAYRSGSSDVAVTTRTIDGVRVLAVAGTIDLVTSPALAAHIDGALADEPPTLVIHLAEVDLLASSGLRVLVQAHRSATRTQVVVAADGPTTSRPMQITGIDEIVPLYRTVDEAVEALRG